MSAAEHSTPPNDPTAARAALFAALAPVLHAVEGVDLSDPQAVAADLGARFPLEGAALTTLRAALEAGLAGGWLTPREADGVRFGRLAKAGPETAGCSIDVVDMDGPGPGHTHPNGEIDLCFALSGAPTFDGRPPGWVVYGPQSWHTPTVRGGRMVIVYLLPGGAIRFEPAPA
ncbi:MAG: DUF4863 family protein [Deltaproteobacteria bacterium]|jgi:hypothetical protein|nr:DUF4863 family protein [Deltaproteobacteria bacterium]